MGRASRRKVVFRGVGMSQRVPDNKIRKGGSALAGSGHQWILMAVYQLSDRLAEGIHDGTASDVHLDTENLLTMEGPGCYRCEEPWSPELASQPCPGEPG